MTKRHARTVWIINQYASTPDTGIGGRHYHIARELASIGVKVYLIAASNHHLLITPKQLTSSIEMEASENLTIVRIQTPQYSDAHSKKRVWNWLLFALQVRKLKRLIPDSPDTIWVSSPPLLTFLAAERLATHFQSKLVFEVRDIWPQTLVEIGGFSPTHPFIRLMQWIEDRAYQKADKVVSNLRYSVEHMISRGMMPEKFTWVSNGFSLSEVQDEGGLNENALEALSTNSFVVGYAGTLGVANALETLLLAAELLKQYSDIKFALVGAGKEKIKLENFARDHDLNNVVFIDPVKKSQVQSVLKCFDVCYIGWRNDSLYRYGIAANKIFDYLYSAKPIIHSFSGNGDLVQDYKAGITVPAEDPVALSEAVLELYNLKEEERAVMGLRGHEAVKEHHEYGKLAGRLKAVLFEEHG